MVAGRGGRRRRSGEAMEGGAAWTEGGGWASKGRGNMSRVRFPRGAPARGKGREKAGKVGFQELVEY